MFTPSSSNLIWHLFDMIISLMKFSSHRRRTFGQRIIVEPIWTKCYFCSTSPPARPPRFSCDHCRSTETCYEWLYTGCCIRRRAAEWRQRLLCPRHQGSTKKWMRECARLRNARPRTSCVHGSCCNGCADSHVGSLASNRAPDRTGHLADSRSPRRAGRHTSGRVGSCDLGCAPGSAGNCDPRRDGLLAGNRAGTIDDRRNASNSGCRDAVVVDLLWLLHLVRRQG
jgi:hypothetical protein